MEEGHLQHCLLPGQVVQVSEALKASGRDPDGRDPDERMYGSIAGGQRMRYRG